MFLRTVSSGIALFLALFLLAGPVLASGGGGGHGGGEAKKEGGGKPAEESSEEGVTGGRFAGDPVYVHMQPIILPLITADGAQQLITLVVDLQIKDFETGTLMHHNMPRLRDTLLQALYGGLADGSLRKKAALDIEKMKETIMNETNRVFGAGSVLGVLIQGVAQRKL